MVHRLRNRGVLEGRFIEVLDIIQDDVTPRGAQLKDVVGEVGLAAVGGGEIKRGARGEVVNDLQHRGPFAGARDAALPRQHRHGAQITQGLGIGDVVNTVREHPDLHPRAVHAERSPRHVGLFRYVPLGIDGVHGHFHRRADKYDIGSRGHAFDFLQRQRRAD